MGFEYTYAGFQQECKAIPVRDVVQRYLWDLFPYCFLDTPEQYYQLRNEVCDALSIHTQNFAIVGSAKLGFSLSPDKLGRPFREESDIDIVLVSPEVFEQVWLDLIAYKSKLDTRLYSFNAQRFRDLQMALFYGQLRMDKLSDDFAYAKDWWKFFNQLSVDDRFGPRQIRAALFKSWHHACSYYEKSFNKAKEERK